MELILARLRAEDQREAKSEYDAGVEEGRRWAMDIATPKELRRLADFRSRCGADEELTPHGVVSTMRPDVADDPDRLDEFWERALGEKQARADDCDFLRGFVEGGAQFWDEVRDKL